MGGLISGILGGGNSGAQEAQMAELQKARQAIQQYRPEAMQARLNALSNISTAYQPMNNAMETMYGGRPAPGPLKPKDGQKFMGHEMPNDTGSPPGAPSPQPSAQRGRPPIGQGNGWEDSAAMLVDPIGIFRGLF